MKISKNFSLRELTRSTTADRLGIDNTLNGQQELVNLCGLVNCILQPIREQFGRTNINSAYRCLELNRAIKSGDNSQHVKAEAADVECPKVSNFELAKWISETLSADMVLLEFYTSGIPDSGWVHVSYKSDGSNRGEALTAVKKDGKTVYEKGLIA